MKGKRHLQRSRRATCLPVPPTKRKLVRRGIVTGQPATASHRNHVWTCDFITDGTVRGRVLKMLTILGEYTVNIICCGWNGPLSKRGAGVSAKR